MRKLIGILCLTLAVLLGLFLGVAWTGSVHDGADSEYFRALKTMVVRA